MNAPSGVVAVDVGGTAIKAGLVTALEPGRVQGRTEVPTGTGDGELSFAALIQSIQDVEKYAAKIECVVVGYGLAVAGPTDATRNIFNKPQLGWTRFPLGDRLRAVIGDSNIVIQNDANAAAFGCWRHTGKQDESLLLVTVSTGVGGGMVLPGGLILDGATGNGAEIGHVPFGEFECGYKHGVGCIEGSVSGSGIRARFEIDPRNATREIRHLVAYELGTAFVGLVASYDPTRLVLMGSVAYGFQQADENAGFDGDECFVAAVSARIREVSVNHRDINVTLSPFGDDSGILGAAALALHKKG